MTILNAEEPIDPILYVWRETPYGLLPEKRELLKASEYTITCKLYRKLICSGKCKYVKNEGSCINYCKCNTNYTDE